MVRVDKHTMQTVPSSVSTLLRVWHRVECWLAVACFIFIACLLVIDVFYREIIGPLMSFLKLSQGSGGFFGAQQLAIFAMVIGSYAGIGIATATASHLVPRVGFGWFPESWNSTINRLADLVAGIVLCITAWYGFQFVIVSKEYGSIAPVINTSPWMIQLAIPLGFLSAALRYFIFFMWPDSRPQAPELIE